MSNYTSVFIININNLFKNEKFIKSLTYCKGIIVLSNYLKTFLDSKFEELYNDLLLKIDEVAERILTLGHAPKHNYTDYRITSKIKESGQVSNGTKGVEDILASFKIIIILQRELLIIASTADDEGTNALMSDYIREQEKLVWMYSSFLNR